MERGQRGNAPFLPQDNQPLQLIRSSEGLLQLSLTVLGDSERELTCVMMTTERKAEYENLLLPSFP
jgi:hypothetical protein